VGIGAAQDLALKHTRNDQVTKKLRLTRNFFDAVDSRNAATYVFEFWLCHGFSIFKQLPVETNKASSAVQESFRSIGN
jgi:hypothetical protein